MHDLGSPRSQMRQVFLGHKLFENLCERGDVNRDQHCKQLNRFSDALQLGSTASSLFVGWEYELQLTSAVGAVPWPPHERHERRRKWRVWAGRQEWFVLLVASKEST